MARKKSTVISTRNQKKSSGLVRRTNATVPANARNDASKNYAQLLGEIKTRINTARIQASISVNRELINLYLDIGQHIMQSQAGSGWGKSIVERLSRDLRRAFPGMQGFSARNLWDMRRLYESCQGQAKLRQLVAEIPWGHNLVLLNKVHGPVERAWYIQKTVEHGWSRNILAMQIEKGLHLRQGKSITNFKHTLPPVTSDLAQQMFKDPYIFDFLTVHDDAHEREIENNLIVHVQKFLLELGVGFAFVGNQYHLTVDEKDYYIDLLFYHIKLHAYVVIEIKSGEFLPEYAGKLNFYLSAVDHALRGPGDNPSIGLILCRSESRLTVEYALLDVKKPIGVSEFQLTKILPKELKSNLPTIKDLERELNKSGD